MTCLKLLVLALTITQAHLTEGAMMKTLQMRTLAASGVPDPHCKTGVVSLPVKGQPQSCCAGYCGACNDYETCKSIKGQASENACCASKVYDMRCGNAPANVCLKTCSEAVPPCIMDKDVNSMSVPQAKPIKGVPPCNEVVPVNAQRQAAAVAKGRVLGNLHLAKSNHQEAINKAESAKAKLQKDASNMKLPSHISKKYDAAIKRAEKVMEMSPKSIGKVKELHDAVGALKIGKEISHSLKVKVTGAIDGAKGGRNEAEAVKQASKDLRQEAFEHAAKKTDKVADKQADQYAAAQAVAAAKEAAAAKAAKEAAAAAEAKKTAAAKAAEAAKLKAAAAAKAEEAAKLKKAAAAAKAGEAAKLKAAAAAMAKEAAQAKAAAEAAAAKAKEAATLKAQAAALAPNLGGKNDAKAKNLEACIGECDSDAQCKAGLKCFQRSGLTPVPGCTGSGKKDWDYCYDPTGSIALSGSNNNKAKNLRACRGECDSDSQCASGLKCFQRSKGETIPGCSGPGRGPKWDYCYDPKIQTPTPAGPLKTQYDARCFDYNYNNKNVYMHPCHKGKNQEWFFDNAGRLKTKHDARCLDYNTNNKNVYMHTCHDGKNQQWYFDDAGRLKTKHDDNCLDYNYNNKNVYMHKCHGGKNQKWYFDGKSQLGAINYEEKAVYKCNTGFTTGGEYNAPTNFNVECLPSGQLSAPTPENQCRNVNDCEQHTCGKKGQCVDLIGPAPAYTCKCDHGYEIQTDSKGEKTCGNKDDCEGRGCGVGTCKDLVGDYTCICPSGHYIGVKDGQKTCVPVQCESSTPTLSNGRLLSSHSGAVNFPTTLRYKCATGYSVDGTVSESMRKFQAQCKPHGQLVGMSSCQKISCGTAHVVPFTTLLLPSSPRRSIEYDDKAKYKCFTGYTVGGRVGARVNFEVKCQDSGSLTDPEVCEPVKCGSPPHVPKSRPSIAGNSFYGQNLMYNCDVGYSLTGTLQGSTQFQRHCQIDGSFSSLSETCKPMSAGNAPTIRHAVMREYAGRRVTTFPPRVYYPNGLEYRCNAGYSTTGSPSAPTKISARVNSIGRFSPALPTACKLIVYQMRSQIKSARSGSQLNGVTVRIDGTSNTATTQNGYFTLRNLRPGFVNVVYERSGYITVRRRLSITGNINSGGIGDINMSPAMASDEWRAALKWGAQPRDLDSFATWWPWKKVCWYNRHSGNSGSRPKVTLEQDKTQGYGPETVYFANVGRCRYNCDLKYMIHDYGETGSMLSKADAEVTLYTGTRVAGTFKIQDCRRSVYGGGNWWHVFTIDSKTNKLKWTCSGGSLIQLDSAQLALANQTVSMPAKPKLLLRNILK